MANYSAINPFPVFLDQRGNGLNGGRVYFGEAGKDPETFPIPVYWDEAGSIDAAQPIATIGGYISRSGTPAEIFAPTEYSIRVRDRFGVQVFYAPNINGPLSGFIETLSSEDGAGLIGWIRNAVGAVFRVVSDKLQETVTFEDFGAVGDGVVNTDGAISGTDDTLPVQNCVDYAAATGAKIKALGKSYRLTSPINVPTWTSIAGAGCRVNHTAAAGNITRPLGGSWFLLDHQSSGFRCRDDGEVGASRLVTQFRDIGTYRHHPAPTSGWSPTVCEEDFLVEFRVHLINVLTLNPYKAVRVRSGGVLWADRLYGQPLFTGIEYERSGDINNIGVAHFWPFWTQNANVLDYTVKNASCLRVTRVDGLRADRIFSYGYAWTLDAQDADGQLSGFASYSINAMYCDKAGGGVRIKSDFYQSYGTINSITVNSDSGVAGNGAAVDIGGAVASLHDIKGLAVTRAHEEAVKVTGAAHVVNVGAYKIQAWSRKNPTLSFAFLADNGATINLLTVPTFSASNNLIYNQGANGGIINYPVRYQITRPIVGPSGFYSQRATIPDDGVFSFAAPSSDKTVNLYITPVETPANGNPSGSVWLRASSSPSAGPVSQLSHTTNVAVGTGVLTGTTGNDGDLTIHSASDGRIYVENRTGVSRVFIFTMVGN